MNNIGEKFLPFGSVVLLKNAKKTIMITGFASVSPETGDKVFDYSGCPYPEGFFNYNQVCVFNHEQIDIVYAEGCIDEEEVKFKTKFAQAIAEIEKMTE